MEAHWGDLPLECKEKIMECVMREKTFVAYEDVHNLSQVLTKRKRELVRRKWGMTRADEKKKEWCVLHEHLVRHE